MNRKPSKVEIDHRVSLTDLERTINSLLENTISHRSAMFCIASGRDVRNRLYSTHVGYS